MKRLLNYTTPRSLALGGLVCMAAWLICNLARHAGYPRGADAGIPENLVQLVSSVAAFSIAFWLCLRIAGEHRQNRWLRMAWTCLGLCAAVSVIRHLFDTPLVDLIYSGYWHGEWSAVMREVLAAIALTFLAVGILTIAAAFWRLGLGFGSRRRDIAAIAGIFLVLGLVLYFRNDLSAARAGESIPRIAQLFSQVMFAIAAAGGVVLLRIGKQMGGGQLAMSMAWLIGHIVIRAVLVLASAVEAHLHLLFPAIGSLHTVVGLGASWMFTIAAGYRYQVTRTAAQQAAEWGIQVDRTIDAAA